MVPNVLVPLLIKAEEGSIVNKVEDILKSNIVLAQNKNKNLN